MAESNEKRADYLESTWAHSPDAVREYLRARTPYQPFLLDYILAYHANVGKDAQLLSGKKRTPQYGAVLDLGCGPGQLGVLLSHHFKKVYARDVSEDMLGILKTIVRGDVDDEDLREVGLKAPAKNVDFDIAVGSDREPNMPDQSVDMIVMGAAAHWFDWYTPESSRKIWSEWSRILRPGGTIIVVGTMMSPGNTEGPLAEATRPLRQLAMSISIDSPVSHYYNKLQASIGLSGYARMPMPWDVQADESGKQKALQEWPKEMRLHSMFDLATDLKYHDIQEGIESDPYPDYMPKELERFVSTPQKIGDAYSTVFPRFKTTTPRRLAVWLRSGSGYLKYFAEHPDDKLRIGRDDDMAARQVKEACAKGNLDYDQEIELHHQSPFLGLLRV